jgi:DNA repair protein RadC
MKREKYKIKDLPEDRRPREKLLKYGAESLTDSELLAIILRTGVEGKSAIDIANEILSNFGSFKGLAGRDIQELQNIKGIKGAKAITIAATFEIIRRVVNQILDDKTF